jgi:hypothetical protein
MTASSKTRAFFAAACVAVPAVFCLSMALQAADPYAVAQSAIDAKYRDQVFWIKGTGTPDGFTATTYYFYDPAAAGKAKMVRVVDGKIDKAGPAEFKIAPKESLVFDPKSAPDGGAALAAARKHAENAKITYDNVKAELRRSASGEPPAWRVSLYQGGRFAGTVYLKPDNTVLKYEASPPASTAAGADKFFKDVEGTFKGIGGDLEEFFTGERTVDR